MPGVRAWFYQVSALYRLSFRQLLFVAFMLIAMVPTAISVQALLKLEQLAQLGRAAALHAAMVTEQTERLTQRTLMMERSAHQFLAQGDTALRDRYFRVWKEANTALQELARALPKRSPAMVKEWVAQSAVAWSVLQAHQGPGVLDHPLLLQSFSRLPEINDLLADAGRQEIERRNDVLLEALERQHYYWSVLLLGSVALAAMLAVCFGIWLSRPLQRIETALHSMGESRYDEAGVEAGAVDVGGAVDIRRLGLQLNWLRQRLADLDQDKGRFLLHISHQLRTPLAGMRAGLGLLDDEVAGPLSVGQREIANILHQNTAALQSRIEDLLRYNAASFDARHLQCVAVDLLSLMQQVVDAQQLQWQARQLQVIVEGTPVSALIDGAKLSAALSHLLSNAVRFSPKSGKIVLRVQPVPGGLNIDCIDQGRGVAPEDVARIFEPLYQGSRTASGAGNGIGLSIAQEYVTAHHGTVKLLGSDVGAHFRIELPN